MDTASRAFGGWDVDGCGGGLQSGSGVVFVLLRQYKSVLKEKLCSRLEVYAGGAQICSSPTAWPPLRHREQTPPEDRPPLMS